MFEPGRADVRAKDTDLIDQAELAKADSDYDWITQDPDTDTVATLKRTHSRPPAGPRLFQDAADLEDLFTLIGPAAPQAADGPTQRWSMYPTGDHNPTPTP